MYEEIQSLTFKSYSFLKVRYKEDYETNKGKNFTEIPETNEMVLSKELRPILSKQLYGKKSKEMLKDVKIGPGICLRKKCFLAIFLQQILTCDSDFLHITTGILPRKNIKIYNYA